MTRLFTRHATTVEFLTACAQRNWATDTARYDAGWDHIAVTFNKGNAYGRFLYNVVNGRFFGSVVIGKAHAEFSSDDQLDGEPWFDELLSVCMRDEVTA